MKRKYILGVIPRYAAPTLILAVVWNSVIYNGSIMLTRNASKLDMTTALEEAIPFQPWWIVIYFGSFIFWAVNYILISRKEKEFWYRFLYADLIAELACGMLFIFLPCTNIRPDVVGNDAFSNLVRMLYEIDPAQNLFPSIHCLVSWFCFIGLRGDKKIAFIYRLFCLLFSLAVCASTLFLKQHCIPDVIVGVLLAEACWLMVRKTNGYRLMLRLGKCISNAKDQFCLKFR